jgi:hypothetical protein
MVLLKKQPSNITTRKQNNFLQTVTLQALAHIADMKKLMATNAKNVVLP